MPPHHTLSLQTTGVTPMAAHTGPRGLPSSSASTSMPHRTPAGSDEEPVQRKRWHDNHATATPVMEVATRQTLQGISSARLPTDVDRPRQQQEQQEEAPTFTVGVLKAFVTSAETSPALLLALYGTLLSRYVCACSLM